MEKDLFILATSDESLWLGYVEWLDEQEASAKFERLLEEVFPLDIEPNLS